MEVAIVMTVIAVAFQIFTSTVVATARQRDIYAENSAAIDAARTKIEILRDEPFEQLFALYNADPKDDPDGSGSAPGATFEVPELARHVRAGTKAVGEVVFPVSTKGIGKDGLVDPAKIKQELREDHEDRLIGMPHDLDGDGEIDGKDHARDYVVLPLVVRVRWVGKTGPRTAELHSIMVNYQW